MLWEYYLCSCIDTIIDKDFSEFPSLVYLQKGKFVAKFDKTKVKRLRLYNTYKTFLHLRGVELYNGTKRVEASAIPAYTVSHGKWYKNEDFVFQFNTIVEPYMFHTNNAEEENWLEIEFATPVELSSLIFYGRINNSYMRSNCLAADIIDENERLTTVYDYQKIMKETSDAVFCKLMSHPVIFRFTPEQIKLLCYILLLAKNDSFGNIKTLLSELEESMFASSLVKRFINEKILYKRKKQFTINYGCQYTYNLWSREEKKTYLKAALDVMQMITPITDKVFFGFGTLLGFVREADGFIPHDYDIDIVVVGNRSQYKTIRELSVPICDFLKKKGVVFVEQWDAGCRVKYNNSRRFDVFFRLEEIDGTIFVGYKQSNVTMNNDECFPTLLIDVLGEACPIPRNPFLYLDKVYGADWRIPQDKRNFQQSEHRESAQIAVRDDVLFKEAMEILTLNENLYRRLISEVSILS